jgi:hypothetical protein
LCSQTLACEPFIQTTWIPPDSSNAPASFSAFRRISAEILGGSSIRTLIVGDCEKVIIQTQTGRLEIWKSSPDGGNPQQVTRNGGRVAFESWDGRWLYYRKTDVVGPIWRMPVAGGAEMVVVSAPAVGRNFVVMGNGIYFLARGRTAPEIDVYRFNSGTMESVVTVGFNLSAGLAVSPDEKRILYSQIDHEGNNIMLVENYQ